MIEIKGCVGCSLCMLVCKFNAIRVFGEAKIDEEKCVKCMRCVDYCPVDAVNIA